ncbi:hypothetical protein BT67DRAFT_475401 [Trichocladium antarcticum]|uniref:BRCT domain-containing protein n=1 Tax=Trichocladium antarcticum TaxID=1450529 RepID=A0AAN6US61_9PEZI|nr:hypothetical protein BT67DRAFT_475401 [Trichocladium antarcticum]
MRSRRREKPIFRGFAIALAGDFGDLGGGQWTDANIARWIGLRGGMFAGRAPLPTRTVTHLVCTAEAFRAGTGREGTVRDVLQRGSSTQIVELDWLEDSLHQQKRLDEAPYSHLRALTVEREREKRRLRNLKGQEQAVRTVNPNLYHVYRDQTYFQYTVLLTRDNEDEGIQGERYVLTIYESNAAQPHLYWFIVKYYKKKGDTHAKVHRPSNSPGVFSRAFAQFESFFLCKTGLPWAQRLLGPGPTTTATAEKKLFRYTPPVGVFHHRQTGTQGES